MIAKPTPAKQADALLKPIVRHFKRQVAEAISEARAEIVNVLTVSYDAPAVARPEGLPAPRLQLRWEEAPDGMYDRVCHYELVFPLHKHDCRNDPGTGFAVVQLGRTRQGGGPPNPWAGDLAERAPFRDGCHAQWDAKLLGDLPIYVIAPDGRSALVPPIADRRP